MIIVADSGSTCTDWLIIENNQIKLVLKTKGFNPYFTKSEEITNELESKFPKDIHPDNIKEIFFYGAGCSSKEMNQIIYDGIFPFFKNTKIEIEHDLLGAARSLFQHEEGIAVILGTGSNTCYYDGKSIIKNITSLGFILGDEGGGDYMGKMLIEAYLNKELPKEIEQTFFDEYKLTTNDILHKIYKDEYPNRFLASFAKFLIKHEENESIKKIIDKSFTDLFEKHICRYENYQNLKIRLTGSISHYFRKHLKLIANKHHATIDLIEKEPVHRLSQYHMSKL